VIIAAVVSIVIIAVSMITVSMITVSMIGSVTIAVVAIVTARGDLERLTGANFAGPGIQHTEFGGSLRQLARDGNGEPSQAGEPVQRRHGRSRNGDARAGRRRERNFVSGRRPVESSAGNRDRNRFPVAHRAYVGQSARGSLVGPNHQAQHGEGKRRYPA
jgi:hypothetical protein